MKKQKLEKLKLSLRFWKTLLSELFYGSSLEATLMNYALLDIKLSGEILDLGAGSKNPKYKRFLSLKKPFKITYSDYYKKSPSLLKINLEKPFGIKRKFDCILCFNVLEHVYGFKNAIKESYKILKPGGLFVGSTPFVFNFHPSPKDFFRYSHQAIIKMFEEEGLVCQRMIFLGFGPLTAAFFQWMFMSPRFLRPFIVFLHIFLDLLIDKLGDYYKMKYPLGYLYVFKKPKKFLQ